MLDGGQSPIDTSCPNGTRAQDEHIGHRSHCTAVVQVGLISGVSIHNANNVGLMISHCGKPSHQIDPGIPNKHETRAVGGEALGCGSFSNFGCCIDSEIVGIGASIMGKLHKDLVGSTKSLAASRVQAFKSLACQVW